MISYSYKTIHIHVKKSGGTSVTHLFPDAIDTSHADFLGSVQQVGQNAKDFFIWSTVRNPWSRAVSMFFYQIQMCNNSMHTTDFKTFVMDMYQGVVDQSYNNFYDFTQHYDYYLDAHGKIALDAIVNLGNVKEDFKLIKEILNLPRDWEYPHIRSSQHADYRSYYDHETIEALGKLADKDIALFGFVFDDPKVCRVPPEINGNWRERFTLDF